MDSKGIRSNKLDLCKKCGKMFLKTVTINVCPRCSGQKYLPGFDEEFKKPYSLEMEKRVSTREIVTKEKDKKWSRKYDRCINCGRNDVEHISKGLCLNCYQQETDRKVTKGEKEQKWSQKHERCRKCGRNDVKHLARGLCLYCYQQETEKRGRGKQRIAKGLASRKLNYHYLYEEYVSKKRSPSDIAKDCDCSRQYVYKKIIEFNIPLRTQTEARKLAYDSGKISYEIVDKNGNERLVIQGSIQINENFFSSWSNEMAYVLGVIFTDGNISPGSKRLSITQKEPELLNKVSKLMNCDMKLSHSKKRGIAGAAYRFDICREKIYDDLINLGLSPRKSKTMEFPNIPPGCVRHFVRGCWDGDGSIFISGGKLRGSYVCGSLKFIEGVVQGLYKAGIHKTKPPYRGFPLTIHKGKRSQSYEIKVDARENLKKLFDYFYDGVDESMYLERKFETFTKGLGVITDGLQEMVRGVDWEIKRKQ